MTKCLFALCLLWASFGVSPCAGALVGGDTNAFEYVLHLKPNGGESINEVTCVCSNGVPFQLPQSGDALISNFIRAGYRLDGWSETATGKVRYQLGETVNTLPVDSTSNAYLFAHWKPNHYMLHFDANQPSLEHRVYGSMPDEQVAVDKSVALSKNQFICPGYRFAGWMKDPSDKRVFKNDGESVLNLARQEGAVVTLFARWEKESASAVFKNAYETNEPTNNVVEMIFSQMATEAIFTGRLSRENTNDVYTFQAKREMMVRVALDPLEGVRLGTNVWARVRATGGTYSYLPGAVTNLVVTDLQQLTNFTFHTGVDYELEVVLTPQAWNQTYTYAFSLGAKGQNLTFNLNGASARKGFEDAFERVRTVNLTQAYPLGYVVPSELFIHTNAVDFLGWYPERLYGKQVSTENLVSSLPDTLYARWDMGPYQYTVQYHSNIPNKDTIERETWSSEETKNGSVRALRANSFVRKNFVFLGWKTKSGEVGDVVYQDEEDITEPLTATNGTVQLYAKWEDHTPVLTQIVDGIEWAYSIEDGVGARLRSRARADGPSGPSISSYVVGCVTIPSKFYNPETSNSVDLISIATGALQGCGRVTEFTIPATVLYLNDRAFRDCTSLTQIHFATNFGVTTVGEGCFAGCSRLASIELPYSVTSIEDSAFADCLSLPHDFYMPEWLDTIGDYVFTNCPLVRAVLYWGKQPNKDFEDSDEQVNGNLYVGTATNLWSGVLRTCVTNDGWNLVVAPTNIWKQRETKYWTPPVNTHLWTKFDYTSAGGSEVRMYVKGHMFVNLPDAPEPPEPVENEFYLANYIFDGWWTAPKGGVRIFPESVAQKAQTLYAHWRIELEPESTPDALTDRLDYQDTYNQFSIEDDMILEKGVLKVDTTRAMEFDCFVTGQNGVLPTDLVGESVLVGTMHVTIAKGVIVNGITNSFVKADVLCDGVQKTYQGTMKNALPVKLVPKGILVEDEGLIMDFNALSCKGIFIDDNRADYEIFGSRRVTTQTDLRFPVLSKIKENYNKQWVASLTQVNGEEIVRVFLSFDAKGVVNVSGFFRDGQTLSMKAYPIVDDHCVRVPLYLTNRQGTTVSALVQLKSDDTLEVENDLNAFYIDHLGYQLEEILLDAGGVVGGANEISFDPDESENAMVGVAYFQQAVLDNELANPAKFSASGLPSGLKMESATGRITGVPTRAVDEKDVVIKATGVYSKWTSATTNTVTIEALPAWAQGTFTGHLAWGDEDSLQVTNRATWGSVSLTVSSIGKISGKIQRLGKTWTFSAPSYDASSDTSVDELVILATAKNGKETRPLSLVVTPDGVTGLMTGEENPSVISLAHQAKWTTDANKVDEENGLYDVTNLTGYYTATLTAEEGDLGTGYLTTTISKTGSVRYAGKLPDGTALSGSTTLLTSDGVSASFAVWSAPSAYKGGCVALTVNVDDAVGELASEDEEPGVWLNVNPLATGVYGDGFETTLKLEGNRYNPQSPLEEIFSAPLTFEADVPNLDRTRKITYFDPWTGRKKTGAFTAFNLFDPDNEDPLDDDPVSGYLKEAEACWTGLSIELNERGTAFEVPRRTTPVWDRLNNEASYEGENDAGLTFSLNKSTGVFKGSFLAWFDYVQAIDDTVLDADGNGKQTWKHESKKISFEGVVNQANGTMKGLYLWSRPSVYTNDKNQVKSYTYKESHSVSFE